MLVALLVILSFAGGCTVVYFLTESTKKRALSQLNETRREREVLHDESLRLDMVSRQLANQEQALAAAGLAHNARVQTFQNEFAVFQKRVITYQDLETENRILKADLKGMAVDSAHQESVIAETKESLALVEDARNRLGLDLFAEIRSAVRKTLSVNNYPSCKHKLKEAILKIEALDVKIPKTEQEQALIDLHSQYQLAVRAALEREEQARIREQIREEQRVEKEAKEELERAERERKAVETALQKALVETEGKHSAEVELLRAQLAEAEARTTRAISMAEITKTGNVYVISNLGSFGRDVFKIGMTRRLEPMDRVYELGDASVPFPFDVHMMISCTDAPKLEMALHRAFHNRRVNKVNLRKEFFRASIDEIVKAVHDHHGIVEYTADAEALEYLQSQNMTEDDLKEVEEVFTNAKEATTKTTAENGHLDD
jgi:hypothetical protein